MAKRGTNKRRSQEQEKWLAKIYDGTVSPSSGAASNDGGDIRSEQFLIEAKTSGGPGEKETKRTTLLKIFEKIAEEAWSEGREPMVALRYFIPDSILSNNEGWVDLVVHLAIEDSQRS